MSLAELRLPARKRDVNVVALHLEDAEGDAACVERILRREEALKRVRLDAEDLDVDVLDLDAADDEVTNGPADHQRPTASLADERSDVLRCGNETGGKSGQI